MNACTKIIMFVLCFLPLFSYGDVYKFIGRNGQLIYTDTPRHKGYQLVIKSREPEVKPVTISLGAGRGAGIDSNSIKPTVFSSALINDEAKKYKDRIKKEVPLRKTGGVYEIPVLVNDVKKEYFVIDSGAADVSIPFPDWIAMISDGTIRDFDNLPSSLYKNASGEVNLHLRRILPKMRVGSKLIRNVVCSIGEDKSDRLLGQSALEKLGKHYIDYKKSAFIIE